MLRILIRLIRSGTIVGLALTALILAHGAVAFSPSSQPTTRGMRGATATGATVPGRYHKLVFADEFQGRDGASLSPRRWITDVGNWGSTNHELEASTASTANVSLDGRGNLAIIARRRARTGSRGSQLPYTSARVVTRFAFTYGRVEARIKIPAGAGLAPTFWMLGSDMNRVGWPACGEIDVMEAPGLDPFVASGHIHGPSARGSYGIGSSVTSPTSLAAGFHTYGIVWQRDSITWTLDGRAYQTLVPSRLPQADRWAFDHPFNLVLNLAVGGEPAGAVTPATRFPAQMLISWLRVYQ